MRLGIEEQDRPPRSGRSRAARSTVSSRAMVEVEVGPAQDFAQLTRFEDAAAGIDGASEINVKRFSGGRATVSMNLEKPIDLLRELEERAPFEFVVRDTPPRRPGPRRGRGRPSRTARRSGLQARFLHTFLTFCAPLSAHDLREYLFVLSPNDKGDIAEAAIALEAMRARRRRAQAAGRTCAL